MAMILTLVNQITSWWDGAEVVGFNLEALLKLNEVSVFTRERESALESELTHWNVVIRTGQKH
jgi:hypothetical protein